MEEHEPPQSTAVSSPLRNPSEQLVPQEPPKSTWTSSPLRHPSEHVESGDGDGERRRVRNVHPVARPVAGTHYWYK